MKTTWPDKVIREDWEVQGFIDAYERLPLGRRFAVDEKREKPDYWLRDTSTSERFGVELTSVYLDDRSVPDQHMPSVEGRPPIPCETEALRRYTKRLVEAVRVKVKKARAGYDTRYPMILSVYVNEYISIYLSRQNLNQMVQGNEAVFDSLAPFAEVVYWALPNHDVLSVTPG